MTSPAATDTVPALLTEPLAFGVLAIFVVAYLFVVIEEFTGLRKSKPLLVAAGLMWSLVAMIWPAGQHEEMQNALTHSLVEFAELFLFLLSAMTFVNTLEERGVFDRLRAALIASRLSLRALFWLTGALAFMLSPVLDNLTTALVMGTVVTTLGSARSSFVVPGCINIVVAANAGGAFSPFGDVTTLMVWQHGAVEFADFFALFVPSLVNWLVPATVMSLSVPTERPTATATAAHLKRGAGIVAMLFVITVAITVTLHSFLHLPAFLGMMSGLGLLAVYGHRMRRLDLMNLVAIESQAPVPPGLKPAHKPFDFFISMKRAEWDTLMFFFGVILCIGALSTLGYLTLLSAVSYSQIGPTGTNVLVGLLSAVVDNIPVMFAVMAIDPPMSQGQWLLVTLTAGVGGSLLSVGSAAGVALMGQARGVYTFSAHLRWSWCILLGYGAAVALHLWMNAHLF